MNLKYSKQREAIKRFLMSRKDHPTADQIYNAVREEQPNISLGTVYRNLALLEDVGEIQRLHVNGNTDRFDADVSNHYHFVCNTCGCVQDIPMEMQVSLSAKAQEHFDGVIDYYDTCFHGKCSNCKELQH
ncbi:MAG: transcriptional repressor [Lachnospiraceae bacterium]|nr:transcriptional repressor [Lachnospiraceae bacterium]